MSAALKQPQPTVSPEEYLLMERDSALKHEYYDGAVIAMAGTSPDHVSIVGNTYFALRTRLNGKTCKPFGTDLRVATGSGGKFVYPDLTVICGPVEFLTTDVKKETVTNSTAIIEILSPSTEHGDRGKKFEAYREIPSFREYILVSQNTPMIETFFRQEDGVWAFNHFLGLASVVHFRSLQIDLPLAEIYTDIQFPPAIE